MKKLLFTFLAAMCCMVMNAQDVTFTDGGIKYNVTGDKTVEVVKNDYTGEVEIPSTVTSDGITYDVTRIGNEAFYLCLNLTSIKIPKGVTSIGNSAFSHCIGLKSIKIPEGVTSIGASAFKSCEELTSITIPEGVTSIEASVFESCSKLNSITIPKGVTSIGISAFKNTGWYNIQEDGPLYLCNYYLVGVKEKITTTDIVIKDGTTTIADEALRSCNSLVSITIPKSVTSIGDWAIPVSSLESITVDSDNQVYDSHNNCNAIIETATNTLITGCKNTIIPSNVTRIGNDAFRGCDQLISVTIPSGVTYIGNCAFFKCSNLTEIYVLATAPPTLGYDAFYDVKKDIPVYVPDVETYTGWGGFTFLIKNVDLPTAKKEAKDDLQTFINKEKIANAPKEKYESSINTATALKCIPSIVNNIKAEINNYTKFTLGEWKYLLDKNDGEYTIVGGSLTFTDKDSYQSDYDFTANNLTYSRTFKATGVWQAWFVPFDVPVSDMNAAGMEVAKIAGVLMDGEVPYIAFAKMTGPYAIVNANTPYVVKATESSVNMTLTGPDMCIRKSTDAELKAQRLTVQSSFDTFTFGGNYQQTNGYANEWYALNTSGVFQKMGDGANLAPQRFWMTIDTRTDTPYHTGSSATAKAFIGMTVLGDDETTGIESLTPSLSEGNGVIYNLQGQKVTSIQKGQVYIMNGKKYLAR